MYLKKDLGTV